jgi:hypothetical protein
MEFPDSGQAGVNDGGAALAGAASSANPADTTAPRANDLAPSLVLVICMPLLPVL